MFCGNDGSKRLLAYYVIIAIFRNEQQNFSADEDAQILFPSKISISVISIDVCNIHVPNKAKYNLFGIKIKVVIHMFTNTRDRDCTQGLK